MNWRTLLLTFVLADFAALSFYVMYQVGYFGIWQAGFASAGSLQILVDLVIVCVLASLWLVQDARRNGLNPWPFVAITLAGGSFGPLLYLLRRELKAVPAAAPGAFLGSHG